MDLHTGPGSQVHLEGVMHHSFTCQHSNFYVFTIFSPVPRMVMTTVVGGGRSDGWGRTTQLIETILRGGKQAMVPLCTMLCTFPLCLWPDLDPVRSGSTLQDPAGAGPDVWDPLHLDG